jgi:hypothetical protein
MIAFMIIDELIALIFSFVGMIIEGFSAFFVLIFNGLAYLIEFIMLLFVSDFSLGRAKRYKRSKKEENKSEYNHQNQPEAGVEKYYPILVVLFVIIFFTFNHYKTRDITFVAEDGHSLPFASIVIYQGEQVFHKRTKNDGSLEIPRFGVDKVVINDKRYKKATWQANEIKGILTVKRSFLGKGVDKLASKLLERIKGD